MTMPATGAKPAIAGAGSVHLVLTAMDCQCNADAVVRKSKAVRLRNVATYSAANKAAIVRGTWCLPRSVDTAQT
jgi:hypothetical protein